MRGPPPAVVVLAAVALLHVAQPARAWDEIGHVRVVRAAWTALPDDVRAALRGVEDVAAQTAPWPDVEATPTLLPGVAGRELPDHYLDVEHLAGAPVPTSRADWAQRVAERKLEPGQVGAVTVRAVEELDKLVLELALLRRFPDDPALRARVGARIGVLSHYTSDLVQPLHTTVHFDGRVEPAGRSPASGIHAWVDGWLGRLPDGPWGSLAPQVVVDPARAIVTAFEEAHGKVDDVYALEVGRRAEGPLPPRVAALARERGRRAAELLASLVWTAWERSAQQALPEWVLRGHREATGQLPTPRSVPSKEPR